MQHLCKVSNYGDQKRITLPKSFLKANDWQDVEYVVIDDSDGININLRRFVHESKNESKGG